MDALNLKKKSDSSQTTCSLTARTSTKSKTLLTFSKTLFQISDSESIIHKLYLTWVAGLLSSRKHTLKI